MSPFFASLRRYAPWCCGLYVLGLIVVSLWPRYQVPPTPAQKEKSSGLFPKEGDNFKVVDDWVVYRLEKGHRRPYKSAEAFLSRPENPPFGTSYTQGGILLCDSVVLLFYPLGVKMPHPTAGVFVPLDKRAPQVLQEGTPLLRRDKVGHLLVYGGLATLLWWVLVGRFTWSRQGLLWRVILLGSLLGFGLELGQQFFSAGRDAEWEDMLMNVLGLWLGAWLCNRFLVVVF